MKTNHANIGFRISDMGFRIYSAGYSRLRAEQDRPSNARAFNQIRNPRVENVRAEIRNRQRSASTLTEVLVAIMITSIGLVSVATLFPLSVLRSVKATQITAATDARYNAEAAIDMYPNMITNPIDPRYPPFLANGQPNNQPTSDSFLTQNYVIDPLGFAATLGLNNGAGLTLGGANLAYQKRPEHYFGIDLNGGTQPPFDSAPWVDTKNGLYGIARYPMTWAPFPRTQGPGVTGPGALAAADYLVMLPDSWPLQYDTVGGTLGNGKNDLPTQFTNITLPTLNLPAVDFPSPSMRIVMFSADGLSCQIRNITRILGTTVKWTEDIDDTGPNATTAAGNDPRDVNHNKNLDHYPLPQSFVNSGGIGVVCIELQERRYTWLLTVRQSNPQTSPPSASVDCVVYFKRTIENIGVDELMYETHFRLGSQLAAVVYPTGNNLATGQPLKPFIKRGGYVFDANNAFWYRVSNVQDPDINNPLQLAAPAAGFQQALLVIDVPANSSNDNNPLIPPRGMFPRGVVDVYPLGTKSYPQPVIKGSL